MAQLSLGCHSILNWLKFKVRTETRIFLFFQHPTSLKLEVINNVLTQFWMNSSFSECKVFTEHFREVFWNIQVVFGQTWDIIFFRQQWFSACCLFKTSFLFSVLLVEFFFCCYPCALTFRIVCFAFRVILARCSLLMRVAIVQNFLHLLTEYLT